MLNQKLLMSSLLLFVGAIGPVAAPRLCLGQASVKTSVPTLEKRGEVTQRSSTENHG